MSTLADRHRRWFEYEKDAQRRTLASLEELHPERRDGEGYLRAVRTFGHMVFARELWLHRLGAGTAPDGPPQDQATHGELFVRLESVERAWDAYLARLDEGELARTVEYSTSERRMYASTAEDVLTQLFSHGAYHRGQIAARVRELGGIPARTDFIFWSRGGE
ncbi:MAG TPA: DinB family protein [Thermoanaerobaculia bacterium]|nr:DinB family protein [Thermoanaerobaculia bacterium]